MLALHCANRKKTHKHTPWANYTVCVAAGRTHSSALGG